MIDPRAKAIAAGLAVAGILCNDSPAALACLWLLILLPLLIASRVFKRHLSFLWLVACPLVIALLVVWGYIVAAPPGTKPGSDPVGGFVFGCTVALRIITLGAVTQLCFLTIAPELMPYTFRRWGLKGEGLLIALGVFALFPELKMRAEQVLTARMARGLVPNLSPLTRLRQLPFLIRPLFAWSLRSALQRSESWGQKKLFSDVELLDDEPIRSSLPASALVLLASVVWLAISVFMRYVR